MTNEQAIEQIKSETDRDKRNDLMMELFTANEGLVMMQYNRYFRGMIPLDDYKQEAYLAFDRAVRTYNPSTTLFSSWMGKNIYFLVSIYIRDRKSIVRVPRNVWTKIKDMGEEERNITLQAVYQRSLDEKFGDEGDSVSLIDYLSDPADYASIAIDQADQASLKQLVSLALDELPPRSRDILQRRCEGETLDSIGEDYGVSRERIRQIERKAIGKLRNGRYHRQLKSFIRE